MVGGNTEIDREDQASRTFPLVSSPRRQRERMFAFHDQKKESRQLGIEPFHRPSHSCRKLVLVEGKPESHLQMARQLGTTSATPSEPPLGETMIEAKPSNRMEWIDALRGFAILLVMWAHTYCPPGIWIYSFHVPLFFVLSGFLFDEKKCSDFPEFLKSKFIRFGLPYFAYSYSLTCLALAENLLKGGSVKWSFFLGPLISMRTTEWTGSHLGAMWFLASILILESVYGALVRLSVPMPLRWIIGAGALATASSRLLPFPLPWAADTVFVSLIFFAFGASLRRGWSTIPRTPLFIATVFAVHLATGLGNEKINIYVMQLGNPVLFLVSAGAGSLAFFLVFEKIRNPPALLRFIGANSLFFYALHQFPVYRVLNSVERFVRPRIAPIPDWIVGLLYLAIATMVLAVASRWISSIYNGKATKSPPGHPVDQTAERGA